MRVLDPGPIRYSDIDLFGDADLEDALRGEGLAPAETTYRLIEIPIRSITDTASMPWPAMGTEYADALRAGQEFPPIVVIRNQRDWSLLDGAHRTHAHWTLGTATLQAYELLVAHPR